MSDMKPIDGARIADVAGNHPVASTLGEPMASIGNARLFGPFDDTPLMRDRIDRAIAGDKRDQMLLKDHDSGKLYVLEADELKKPAYAKFSADTVGGSVLIKGLVATVEKFDNEANEEKLSDEALGGALVLALLGSCISFGVGTLVGGTIPLAADGVRMAREGLDQSEKQPNAKMLELTQQVGGRMLDLPPPTGNSGPKVGGKK